MLSIGSSPCIQMDGKISGLISPKYTTLLQETPESTAHVSDSGRVFNYI